MKAIDKIATEVEEIAHTVRGASDVQRERLLGLPELGINSQRRELARYGLNVDDVLDIIRIAIAGRLSQK